jgi:hypothetical protein
MRCPSTAGGRLNGQLARLYGECRRSMDEQRHTAGDENTEVENTHRTMDSAAPDGKWASLWVLDDDDLLAFEDGHQILQRAR